MILIPKILITFFLLLSLQTVTQAETEEQRTVCEYDAESADLEGNDYSAYVTDCIQSYIDDEDVFDNEEEFEESDETQETVEEEDVEVSYEETDSNDESYFDESSNYDEAYGFDNSQDNISANSDWEPI